MRGVAMAQGQRLLYGRQVVVSMCCCMFEIVDPASPNRSAAEVAVFCSGVALLAATNNNGVGCGVMNLLALSTALTPQAWGLR